MRHGSEKSFPLRHIISQSPGPSVPVANSSSYRKSRIVLACCPAGYPKSAVVRESWLGRLSLHNRLAYSGCLLTSRGHEVARGGRGAQSPHAG